MVILDARLHHTLLHNIVLLCNDVQDDTQINKMLLILVFHWLHHRNLKI